MADNVKFKDWQCHDDGPAIHREMAIKRALAFAGVHATQALDAIADTFNGVLSDAWEGSGGTWSIVSNKLQGVGGGAAQWYKTRHITEAELGYVVTFDKTGDRGMFVFCSDDSYNAYYFYWTGTVVSMGEMVAGSGLTNLAVLPCAETGDASVTIMVWPQQHTAIDKIDDVACALWFDDKLLLVHSVVYDAAKGKKIGFGVYESDTITFDNLRVPQLHQIMEWASVDPGEAASAGMSRVIAQSRIRVQARYDGSVKIWRNNTTTSDWTAPTSRQVTTMETQQMFWPNHLRLAGALHESDVFRTGSQGHIFAIGQDPNALSEDATYDVAEEGHRIAEEAARNLGLMLPPNPALEPEDVITHNGTKWRVSSINYRITWRGGQGQGTPVLESQLQTRGCEEPT